MVYPYLCFRRFPIGAEVLKEGVHFRVWAPKRTKVQVVIRDDPDQNIALEPEGNGYFSKIISEVAEGSLYQFKLDDDPVLYPDPGSRFQPLGPHGPSQVIYSQKYQWKDQLWKGVSKKGQIIYEMHIGTFTHEGTWKSATEELKALSQLGITVIEMMPIAEFPGQFGWGYDGVDLFAPMHIYGTPDDLRHFIDQAHQLAMGVILDVVYNHLGPDGNYLKQFSDDYFSQKHKTEWGDAINFDDKNSQHVREFFIANAGYWIEEFHFDGLRIDASQNIYDDSKTHILTSIQKEVRLRAKGRSTYIVAENEPQQAKLVRSEEKGGYGLDALWNDDFHHSAIVRMIGRNEAYYKDYKGHAQEFISALKFGFLYQGQWYSWQKKKRGTASLDLNPESLIHFIQNHDQIANSAHGRRAHQITDPGTYRAMTALLLLGPQTPMLFQGQEFGASNPFNYFADHKEEIAKKVFMGRYEFYKQFPSIMTPEIRASLPKPSESVTFLKCKLDFNERVSNEPYYLLHQDLIQLRKNDLVFNQSSPMRLEGSVIGPEALLLRYFTDNEERLVLVNFGLDLFFDPSPEPLIAPPENHYWELIFSSEDPKYGGSGTVRPNSKNNWNITGHCLMVLQPKKIEPKHE